MSVDKGKVTKDGMVFAFTVADESGAVIMTLWDRFAKALDVGDIVLVTGGFITMFQKTIRLACKLGQVIRLGRFCMLFSEAPNVSLWEWTADPTNQDQLVRQRCFDWRCQVKQEAASAKPMKQQQQHKSSNKRPRAS